MTLLTSLPAGWRTGFGHDGATRASATVLTCLAGAVVAGGYAEVPGVAAALLLGLAAVATISPGGALGASILALPTAFRLYPFPVGSFSLLEISILTLSLGLGIRLVLGRRESIEDALHGLGRPIAVTVPAFAIMPVAALAYLMLPGDAHHDVALREIRVTLAEPFLLFASALIIMRDERSRSHVWRCVAAIGSIIGLGACIQIGGGFGGVDTGSITRATGIYSHPNNLALFLERTFLLTLPMLAFRPRDRLLWIALLAQGAGIFLTFSRGALLAVMVGGAVMLVLLGMRHWLRIAAGITAVVGAALFIIGRERLLDLGGSGSEPTRFAIWRSSVRMLVDHPVFGVGPDQFLYQYGLRYIEPAAWDERYTSHPHNIVLDVWLRLGAAGVGAFAALTFGVWSFVTRNLQRVRTDAIACGAAAALAGGLAHGLVDNGFFLPDLAGMTWIAIAMMVTVSTNEALVRER